MKPLFPFLILFVAEFAIAAEELVQFQWAKQIVAEPLEQEEILAVPVDLQVYVKTDDSLSDVRIVNHEGEDQPFMIRRRVNTKTREVQKTWAATDISLEPDAENGLQIHVGLEAEAPAAEGVKLLTPLQNFEQRVTVEAIDEDGEATTLVENALIFDYSDYMDVRQIEIPFPKSAARQFRITVDKLTTQQRSELEQLTRHLEADEETSRQIRSVIRTQPFRIDRIEFWANRREVVEVISEEHRYELTSEEDKAFTTQVDPETSQTIVNFSTATQPLTAIEIVTPDRNFRRHARLHEVHQEKPGNESLVLIGTSHLLRYDFQDVQKEKLSLSFPVSRHGRYQLTIENGDNAPLRVDDMNGTGYIEEILFIAHPDENYRLEFGAENATPPDYDTATLTAAIQKDVVPQTASLGPAVALELKPLPPQPFNFLDLINNRWFVGAVVLFLLMILGILLYSATRQIESAHEETEPS